LEILQKVYEQTGPIVEREFSYTANGRFLSSVHYNYYLNLAVNSYLIPFYQLCGLLANCDYDEVIEARSEGEIRRFEDLFGGEFGDRSAISTQLACQSASINHKNSAFDLYQDRASKQIGHLWRKIRRPLSRLKRKFHSALPQLDGNSRSIIPLGGYDFPWVASSTWRELGFETRGLPKKHLSNGYEPNFSRIDSLASTLLEASMVWIKDSEEFAPDEKRLIEHVLSIYFVYYARQLDLFSHLIRGGQESYDAVRVMSIPTVWLDDVVYVRSLAYKQARLISWQHGGIYGFTELPIFLHHDILNCDVFLGYGTSTQTYVDDARLKMNGSSYAHWGNVKVLGTYAIPAKVARRSGSTNPINRQFQVLYACRDYQPVINNLANAWVMTSLLYYNIQKEIISALAKLDWADITVQPHPGNPESAVALRDWADDRGYRNVRFGEPGAYRSALKTADAVICDFPSSSFVEALWSGLPVIVYHAPGSFELAGHYFEKMSDSVHLVSDSEELVAALGAMKGQKTIHDCRTPEGEAFLIGRVPGFSGESELWQSILA
jgi:glycosyltransferase involved in cell wall biosynthesis